MWILDLPSIADTRFRLWGSTVWAAVERILVDQNLPILFSCFKPRISLIAIALALSEISENFPEEKPTPDEEGVLG
jgi:hypothetical protein